MFGLALGSALGLGLGARQTWAAAPAAFTPTGWPSGQPITVIVPGAPGNLPYNMMKFFLAERFGAAFGVAVNVVDRADQDYSAGAEPGVAVNAPPDQFHDAVGVAGLVKAAPDGHTLAFADISELVRAFYLGKISYDPAKDFAPVASLFAAPVLLLATSALSAQDTADFKALLARAKQKPGALQWATRGAGSLGHLILEQVQAAAGVNIAPVPYPDDAAITADALAGKFDLLAIPAGPALIRPIKDGQLRPLAVAAPARLKEQLPGVPTLAELDLPSANLSSIFGFFAPAGTPSFILQKLTQVINAQSRDAEVQHHIDAQGLVAVSGSAANFSRAMTEMAGYIRAALQRAGIKTVA
jgi:tripartite-type tricarboxylate transporter receptor subunit TctC